MSMQLSRPTSLFRQWPLSLMLSLAFAQLGFAVVFKWNAVTGGSDGLAGLPRLGLPARIA